MIVLAAFSRYREFKADEGSAKMLGKAPMLAALKKLGTLHDQLAGKIPVNDKLATLQISSYKISRLFGTHPAIEDRIKALDARYDLG